MIKNYKGNSAYIKMVKRDKRQLLSAKLIGSALLIASAGVLSFFIYSVVFMFLSLGV